MKWWRMATPNNDAQFPKPHPSKTNSHVTLYKAINFSLLCLFGCLSVALSIVLTHPVLRQGAQGFFITCSLILGIIALIASFVALRRYNVRITRDNQRLQQVLISEARQRDQMRVAADIAREASIGTSVDETLRRATEELCNQFGYYHVAIYLLEDEDGSAFASMKAVAGGKGSYQMLANGHSLPVGSDSMIGYVAHSGQPRVALDIEEEIYHLSNTLLPDTRSELTVPLRVEGRVIGVVDVQSTQMASFTQNDIVIIQTLADLLAVAIDKASLHQQIRKYADNLERIVDDRTQELAQERAQLNAILDAMTEGVIYEEGADARYINRAFSEMLGYDIAHWDGLLPVLDTTEMSLEDVRSRYEAMSQTLNENGFWQGEVVLKKMNNEEFPANLSLVRVKQTGRMAQDGTVAVVRDIRQEKALRDQRKRFVAYASHELRTPLTNLKTRLFLLRRKPHELQYNIDIMEAVMDRMQRLVDDLLQVSRLERGVITLTREALTLQAVVEQIITEFDEAALAKKLTLTLSMSATPIQIHADRDGIAQVLTNLLSNAINYTPEKGSISVTVTEAIEQTVKIVVRDTGVGIPSDKIEAIFQPFVRVKNTDSPGTGLGLNITRELVHLHGGTITVDSVVDEGSTFTVTLPTIANTNAAIAATAQH